jgi:tRNA nucleotidyltransferase (CCA-adding enzyme)
LGLQKYLLSIPCRRLTVHSAPPAARQELGYNILMDVILTHEQADFDALGSLLAAALLENHQRDNQVIAVIPRRINRNGKMFLALYEAELPFTDPAELPSGPIDHILLVDTQALITLKGMGALTHVKVIDHHPLRPAPPPGWSIEIGQAGACTTLLVEKLQEQGIAIGTLQATLMLLGIYEDTGSLSYISTTPRDVHAAGYLLEQGASLHILADYLNPPLSVDQRQLYDRLQANAETRVVNGQSIIISMADARELTDEVSSVAHKLRDFFEPDALFLLVNTDEGIRLIGRSTTDQINVAAIASEFNGGGHGRAAAALIRAPGAPEGTTGQAGLDLVYQQLIDLLPRHVHPAVTVGQIMSHRPRLISPETSAEEAARLMRRYGYEGFPVVKDHKVVGLLNRRSVDRANSHQMNLPAESLMESGQVSVHPGDSLERLQEVMVSSGWGQVPVVDPESGKVIGIVTRTDLIKTLTAQPGLATRQNLAEKLEAALPADRLALLKAVAEKAHTLHMALFLVGGFVRDLLLGRPSLDFDLVVEGDAITLGKALAAQYGGRVVTHHRFGTAKWRPPDHSESIDLVSSRTEYYERPTALPTVESGSIKLDLHRRDFAINTLALRLDGRHYGELHNYWDGLNDLRQGVVRVLHPLSFVDDPTRLLRAVRFEQRFGFRIEARTLQLMEEARPLLRQVSGERLRHELDLILGEEKAAAMLARLDALGILTAIHPALVWKEDTAPYLPCRLSEETLAEWDLGPNPTAPAIPVKAGYLVWLASLPEASAAQVSERLRFPHSLAETLLAAIALRRDLPSLVDAAPSQVVERVEAAPMLAVFASYLTAQSEPERQILWLYASRWRQVRPIHNGDSLQAMGLPPSPVYRTILKALRDGWLDGKIQNAEEEETLLGTLMVWKQPSG